MSSNYKIVAAIIGLAVLVTIASQYKSIRKINYNQQEKTRDSKTISKPELIVNNIKFTWKPGFINKESKHLHVSGTITNLTSAHIFDQIIRSFTVTIKFKNGHLKEINDNVQTIDKSSITLSNALSSGYDLAFKSFLKKDQILQPNESINFNLGDDMIGGIFSLSENELLYPIENINLTLIGEARTPLNHVWRGKLAVHDLPLKF